MKAIVDYCLSKNMRVLLDPHNFRYIYDNRTEQYHMIGENNETTNIFADFWQRMALIYKDYSNVMFGLMNEPSKQTPEQWRTAALSAIKAIRNAGANQTILIPGTSWTGAHAWVSSGNASIDFIHPYLDHTQMSVLQAHL